MTAVYQDTKETKSGIQLNKRINSKGHTVIQYKAWFKYLKDNGEWSKAFTKSCRTRKEGGQFIKDKERELVRKGDKIEQGALLFRDFAEKYKTEWLSKIASGKAEKAKVDLMIDYFGDTKLAAIRRNDIDEFKHYLETTPCAGGPRKGKKRAPRGVDGYLMRLRDLLKYAETKEYIIAPSFKDGLLTPKLYKKRKLTISFDDFLKMLAACDVKKDGYDRKHLRIVLIGLHQLACRRGELQQIKVEDVDLDSRIVKVWEGKQTEREQRDAYISDILLDAILESGVMDKPKGTRVFGETKEYKRAFKTAKTLAGIDGDFRLNDLRRTGITNMVQSGMTLAAIQKQVGHKANSAMTYDIYTKLSPEFIREENQKVEEYYRKFGSHNYRQRVDSYRLEMEKDQAESDDVLDADCLE